jgi:hypothetical protein
MYMLGLAVICWAIWKACNRTVFDKKHIKSSLDIIISLVSSCGIGQVSTPMNQKWRMKKEWTFS